MSEQEQLERKSGAFDRLLDILEPSELIMLVKMAAAVEDDDLLDLLVNHKAAGLVQVLEMLRDGGRILAVGGGVEQGQS